MQVKKFAFLVGSITLLLTFTLLLKEKKATPPSKSEVLTKIAKIEVPFIQNQGQINEQVLYYAKTFGGTVFVTKKGEIVYSLPADNKKLYALKESFPNANGLEVKGEEKAPTKVSYFIGNDPKKWKSNIPTYKLVKVGKVAEGVELKLKAYGKNVEKLFYVKPGADVESIKVKVEGAQKLEVSKNGELVVNTPLGEVKFTNPIAYQEVDGKRKYSLPCEGEHVRLQGHWRVRQKQRAHHRPSTCLYLLGWEF